MTGGPPHALRIARGARSVEALLLRELADPIEAARADPRLLGLPIVVAVPSRSLREHLAATLVRHFGRSIAGLSLRSLRRLALDILERAGETPRDDPHLFRLLVRRLAREEPALRAGLDRLVDGYGVVVGGVEDLLDAGFSPGHADAFDERLADGAERGSHVDRARALVRVAARAAELVERGAVPHRSQLFRRARDLLARDPRGALPARGIYVHGFADATGVQTDLIEALVRLCGARVYLDRPPDPAAPDETDVGAAFGGRFRAQLEAVAGGALETPAAELPEVAVLHAPGPDAEARAVADRLRALLDRGVRPEGVAVVARDFASYRIPLRRHLERLGIPFSGLAERGPAGAASRRLEALVALLRLREAAPAERWLDALVGFESGADGVARAEPLSALERADLLLALRSCGVARLAQVAALDPRARFGADPNVALPVRAGLRVGEGDGAPRAAPRGLPRARLEAAVTAARSLCARWEGWPATADLSVHLRELRRLVEDDLGWAPELLALETGLGARGAAPAGFEIAYEDLLPVLAEELPKSAAGPLGGQGAGVQLLSVMEARARSFDHLFLVGMNRNVFPRRVAEDALLPDSLRSGLRVLMPPLPVKADGSDEERFLFAQLLSSSPSVTLCCSLTDDDGKARPLSPLVERLRRAPHVAEPVVVPSLYAAPTAGSQPAPPRPAHEHAQLAGLHGSRARFRRILPLAIEEARECPGRGGALAAPELARVRAAVLDEMDPPRALRRTLGPYFGFAGAIAEPADPRRAGLYITTVEGMAACPWQTFVARLLHIEPPPDPLGPLPGFSPRLLGSLVHEVLQQIASAAGTEGDASLEAIAEREARSAAWPDPPALAALVQRCAAALLRREGIALEGFAGALERRARRVLDLARELAWAEDGSSLLGAEIDGSVAVRDASGAERTLHFRADRVDRVGGGLRLTDYKTGKPPARQQSDERRAAEYLRCVERGELLQAVAYALAVGSDATPGEGRYLYLNPDAPSHALAFSVRSDDPSFRAAFASSTRAVLEAWDRGSFFPRLADPSGEEPRRCQSCEVKDACLRGDSGARARVSAWAADAAAPAASRALASAERALLGVWELRGDSQ
ncbi:MAG: PD-(D/E)XK nuclease family protein [Myxococcota bacterium]